MAEVGTNRSEVRPLFVRRERGRPDSALGAKFLSDPRISSSAWSQQGRLSELCARRDAAISSARRATFSCKSINVSNSGVVMVGNESCDHTRLVFLSHRVETYRRIGASRKPRSLPFGLRLEKKAFEQRPRSPPRSRPLPAPPILCALRVLLFKVQRSTEPGAHRFFVSLVRFLSNGPKDGSRSVSFFDGA